MAVPHTVINRARRREERPTTRSPFQAMPPYVAQLNDFCQYASGQLLAATAISALMSFDKENSTKPLRRSFQRVDPRDDFIAAPCDA